MTKEEFKWTTADGRKLLPSEMGTNHIKNCLALQERRKSELNNQVLIGHDLFTLDEEIAWDIMYCKVVQVIDIFEQELRRRNLENDHHFDSFNNTQDDILSNNESNDINEGNEIMSYSNYSTAAFLVNDDVMAIEVIYEQFNQENPTARRYTYKTLLGDLAIGDMVVVPCGDFLRVAKVMVLDAEIQFHSNIEYKWVVQKIDLSNYEALLVQEKQMIAEVRKVDRKARRAKLKEEWLEQGSEALKTITFDITSEGGGYVDSGVIEEQEATD